jgi:gliding motility-associated-like protein
MRKLYYVFAGCFVLSGTTVFSQITTSNTMTPAQMVQNVLLGGGITATNITYTGYVNGISTFTATAGTNLGFSGGIYLTTGSYLANDPANSFPSGQDGPFGPSSNFQSVQQSTTNNGDADLDAIVSPLQTEDAVVLEFDFVSQSDSVKFRYTFGSEEYNEFVSPPGSSSGYNDVFAFILSGGTTIPLSPTNIALIPGTTTPVSIFNVNNGSATPSAGPCVNCQYFRDNTNGAIDCTYDGMTKVLTARYAVTCGETYHIKIAIADVGDHSYDSGVFLEAGSFTSSAPFSISTSGLSIGPIGSANTLYESCGTLNLLFTRPPTQVANADTLVITVDGTASPADYTGLNDSIFFPVGVDTVFASIFAPNEGIADAGETVHIFYTYTNPCNVVDTIDYTFTIQEPPTLNLTSFPNDTAICSAASVALHSAVSGGVAPYLYNWSNQSGTTVGSGANYTAVPPAQTYYYYVTDACRQDTIFESVNVGVNTFLYLTGTLDVLGSSNDTVMVEGCGHATLTFTEHGAGSGAGNSYNITISGTIDNAGGSDMGVTIPAVINIPNGQTTVTYNLDALTDGNTEGTEYISILIDYSGNPCIPVSGQLVKTLYIKDPSAFSVNLTNDTTICKGRGLSLRAIPTGGGGTITYAWSHNSSLTNAIAVVTPTVSTTYYVTATESCNGLTATDSVHVTVLYDPPVIDMISLDSICIGETYHFNTSVSHGIGSVTGTWSENHTNDLQSDGTNTWAIYSVGVTESYIYTVTDQCNVKDKDTLTLLALDCELIVPNIVTMNGDNVNEIFKIKNLEKNPGTAVAVFDRWGKKVFSSDNYDNKWKPIELHDGVYFWVVEPQKRNKQNGFLHVLTNK